MPKMLIREFNTWNEGMLDYVTSCAKKAKLSYTVTDYKTLVTIKGTRKDFDRLDKIMLEEDNG